MNSEVLTGYNHAPYEFAAKFIERIRPPDLMGEAMNRLGCVEIFPEERPFQKELNWSGFKARTLFRLKEGGKFIYDPEDQLTAQDREDTCAIKALLQESLPLPASEIRYQPGVIHTDASAIPKTKAILYWGILRRLISVPEYRTYVQQALDRDDEDTIGLLANMMHHDIDEILDGKENSSLPSVLIVTHHGVPGVNHFLTEQFHPKTVVQKLVQNNAAPIEQVLDAALSWVAWPYEGAGILAEEAHSTKQVGQIHIADFKDCSQEVLAKIAKDKKPAYTFIAGTLSFDAPQIPDMVKTLQNNGSRVIIGGNLASLDPQVLLQHTTADIFLGEAEGAMPYLFDLFKKASPDERFVFVRNNMIANEGQVVTAKVTDQNYTLVYLPLDGHVNMSEYYSSENQKGGKLAMRKKVQKAMEPTIKLGEREFEHSLYSIQQAEFSRGCPHNCGFCSTVGVIGTDMRRKPIDMMELEARSWETHRIIANDQNFGAQGENESDEQWREAMENIFNLLKNTDKYIACQTELDFFKRLQQEEYGGLRDLVSQTMVAALSGLESEGQLRGNTGKNPQEYQKIIESIDNMKIILLGTIIAGIPDNMLKRDQHNDMPLQEAISSWIRGLGTFIPIVFPAVDIVRTRTNLATHPKKDPMDNYSTPFIKEEAQGIADAVNRESHSLRAIMQRAYAMRKFELHKQRLALTLGLGFWFIYQMPAASLPTVFNGGMSSPSEQKEKPVNILTV